MSKYIVLDTNVIVSALLSHHNDSATVLILNKVLQNELKVVYNKEILNEYRVVLSRNKFRFEPELIENLIYYITTFGICIETQQMNIKIPDLKDLPFYEVLHFSEYMNTILIIGNKKHFPCEEFILTPSEYSKKFYP